MGGDAMGESQYAEAAMYIEARGRLFDMMRSSQKVDWTDADVEKLLKSYIEREDVANVSEKKEKRKAYAGVGDYFSQEDYEQVRKSGDNVFSRYAAKARQEKPVTENAASSDKEFDLYTETLARIYLEQGYPEQAKSIYSKLILAYPEKNAYFAALIQKIDELNQY